MKLKTILVGSAPLLLTACSLAGPTEVIGYPSPVDETAQLRMVAPASVLTGYTHRMPAEPKSWRDLNRNQTPGAGQ